MVAATSQRPSLAGHPPGTPLNLYTHYLHETEMLAGNYLKAKTPETNLLLTYYFNWCLNLYN